MRLALGTVQFGQAYGVTNDAGQVSESAALHLLEVARSLGFAFLDTASGYGDAESVIGLYAGREDFRIVTKTPPWGGDAVHVERALLTSLGRLRVPRVHGLMAHRAADLLEPDGRRLWDLMRSFRSAGLVDRVGVSVYDPQDAMTLSERFDIDIVQAPLNLLDQRLLSVAPHLRARGVEIHARSPFLQGVLLADPDVLPPHFQRVRARLHRLREHCERVGLDPLRSALGFACSAPVDAVVVGVLDERQLREVAQACDTGFEIGEWTEWAVDEATVIDPSMWASSEVSR